MKCGQRCRRRRRSRAQTHPRPYSNHRLSERSTDSPPTFAREIGRPSNDKAVAPRRSHIPARRRSSSSPKCAAPASIRRPGARRHAIGPNCPMSPANRLCRERPFSRLMLIMARGNISCPRLVLLPHNLIDGIETCVTVAIGRQHHLYLRSFGKIHRLGRAKHAVFIDRADCHAVILHRERCDCA